MSMLIYLFVTFLALSDYVESGTSPICGPGTFKIPERIRPIHYDLWIAPDATERTTEGRVDIQLEVVKPLSNWKSIFKISRKPADNQIVLNSDPKFISINEETISFIKNERNIKVKNVCYDETNANVMITLEENLHIGDQGTLHIDFHGMIQDKTSGIFRDDSHRYDGFYSRQLLTQLEATDARKLFPCFDEPSFKATFQLSVLHSIYEIALSNTEVVSTTPHPHDSFKTVTKFAKTPVMSSYLVAFAIGTYDHIERVVANGDITIRVYTPPGRAKEGQLALDTAYKALNVLPKYFGIEFPLKKVDFISSPNFAFGGMENYGLIVYADHFLLVSDDSSSSDRQYSKQTVVHELTHHWLGNMVTLKWWNDAWINEGLTNFFGIQIADEIYPGEGIELNRRANDLMATREEDSHKKVRPESVMTEEEIGDAFWENYEKGTSITRMLRDYVGLSKFQIAIHDFINTYKYKNAQVTDIVPFMESYSGKPIAKFIQTWLNYEGHPMFSVSLNKNMLRIKQTAYSKDSSKNVWSTPMKVLIASKFRQTEIEFTIDTSSLNVDLPEWFNPKDPGSFIKVNPNGTGLFHVLYAPEMFDSLVAAISEKRISMIDRIDILSATSRLVTLEKQSANNLQQLFYALKDEEDPVVVQLMLDVAKVPELMNIAELLAEKLFLKHKLTEPKEYDVFHLEAYVTVLSILAANGDEQLITEAHEMFEKDFKDIPVSMRDLVYSVVIATGTEEQFERLIKWARETRSYQERARAYGVLSNVHTHNKLKTLITALNEDPKPFANKSELLKQVMVKLEEARV